MKIALPTLSRPREETRARIAQAVTEMSCRIAVDTLDATLRAAREARQERVDPTSLTQVEALSANARNLARNVDTILWTGLPEAQVTVSETLRVAPTTHRSLSVGAVIHKFAALHDAFSHIHPPAARPAVRKDDLCEEAAPS